MYRTYFKRLLDIAVSGLFLILLCIPMLIVAIFVRTKLGRPVIFKQKRPGLHEDIFTLYKFRTMTDDKNKDGELLSDEMRLTKFGRFLRSTSLDELPELYNIFIGEMSLVGPRPLMIEYLPYYSKEERLRHKVRPGLTGLAQVNGRNRLEWDERLQYDIEYVNTISFKNDLKIIFLTIKKVIKKEDIAMGDKIAMLNFDEERRNSIENSKG